MPKKGLFKYVSSPNYFGEILEWIGWAILTWSLAGLAFAMFTIANLLPRALANHRWYQKNFDDYPDRRKVIIPFLF
ncbi:MAG: 3-oxo-5-alpha-steroid 4-dehydrogenase [Actinomycetia bacterium]|nr:3-oxo-5-alpha-steroid 4-dehydrogenase [Actinomycetes bacterium]